MSHGRGERSAFDQTVADWEDNWVSSISWQIHELHLRRLLHDEFMGMLDAQDHPDTDVFRDQFHRMYIESQVMAIRRQVDEDGRTLSLRRLMGQLEQHRSEMTRSWFVERWLRGVDVQADDFRTRATVQVHRRKANEAFDRFTDTPGGPVLSGRRLQDDRSELLEITEAVVRYANATVAHSERGPGDVGVTYAEFHRSVARLGEMLQRYVLLVSQDGLVSATPVVQRDWKGPFRKPLA